MVAAPRQQIESLGLGDRRTEPEVIRRRWTIAAKRSAGTTAAGQVRRRSCAWSRIRLTTAGGQEVHAPVGAEPGLRHQLAANRLPAGCRDECLLRAAMEADIDAESAQARQRAAAPRPTKAQRSIPYIRSCAKGAARQLQMLRPPESRASSGTF